MNHRQFRYPPPPPRRVSASYLSYLRFLLLFITAAVMLTGCPSPNEGNPPSTTTTGGGGTAPEGGGTPPGGGDGKPDGGAAVRTLSFNLELSDPGGNPLALGSGPSLTTVTSDKGTATIGTVSGKIYPITVRNVPQAAKAITLTVKKRGFVDTTVGPITVPASRNPAPQIKTLAYALTTTVSGKVVTPARAADSTKGSHISTAQVWASTDPTNKVPVNTSDGSYSLNGVKHSGTFTITAEYTAGDGNYKTSDPKTVSTTAPTHTQDIALKYGYTTTFSGRVLNVSGSGSLANGVEVVIEVEGVEAARDTTRNIGGGAANDGKYSITADHPGSLRARVIPPPSSTTIVTSRDVTTTSSTFTQNVF